MSHLLEHLYYDRALFYIREVYRILKKGDLVRISVLDLDKIIANYDHDHPNQFLGAFFEVKQKRDKTRHLWRSNAVSLRRILKEIGFREVY